MICFRNQGQAGGCREEMKTAPSPMPVRNLTISSAHILACAAMGVNIVKSDHIHTPTSKTTFEE